MKIVLFVLYVLLISAGASAVDRKPLRCKNPSGKLWSSILNKNCGQSVCKKSGNKASWTECEKAATEAKMEEVIKNENKNLNTKIKEVTKMQKVMENKIEGVTKMQKVMENKIEGVTKMQEVMENQLRKILEKICQDCGEVPGPTTTTTESPVLGVIVSGGYISGPAEGITSTEVFLPSSSGAGSTCSLQSMPSPRRGHTLDQLDDGTVLACGGFGTNTQNTCDKFDGTSWSQNSTLQYSRYSHTSLVGQHGLLLMGGSLSPATTELVGGGEQYNLQQYTSLYCGITVTEPGSDNTIILTGGAAGDNVLNTVVIYDYNGFIDALPSLKIERFAHGCGVVFVTGKKVFVVAGGYNDAYLDSTELLYEGGDSWVTGKALPRTLFSPASVSLPDSVLLLGGAESRREILSFNASLAWSVVGTLQQERSDAAAAAATFPSGHLDLSNCPE